MPVKSTSSVPIFFTVCCKKYEGSVQNNTVFADIIRSYFEARKRAAGKIIGCKNGLDIFIRYKIGKRKFFWCKKSGKAVLQETYRQNYGYCIVMRNLSGEIISKARYNKNYIWMQTAYYQGDTSQPQALLKPMDSEDGLALLKFIHETGKYSKIELRPFPYHSGTPEQSFINTIVGEPQVYAKTNCGSFCYCSDSELESRRAVMNDLYSGKKSLVPKWPAIEGKTVDFKYIENDIPIPEPKEENQSEKLLLSSQEFVEENYKICNADSEKPNRYSVAVKGLNGKAKISENIPLHIERDTKRIVISAQESYTYFGKVIDGLREGRGRTEMQNGCTAYEGDYINDKRNGFGTYYYKSGKICYIGSWKDNKRDGLGVAYSSRDGSIFIGSWENNIPTGNGAAFDSGGNLIYTGEWKNGLRHGKGTEYKNGNIIFRGEFLNDKYYEGYKYIKG